MFCHVRAITKVTGCLEGLFDSFLFVFSCLLNWKKAEHTFILKGKQERLTIEAKSGSVGMRHQRGLEKK